MEYDKSLLEEIGKLEEQIKKLKKKVGNNKQEEYIYTEGEPCEVWDNDECASLRYFSRYQDEMPVFVDDKENLGNENYGYSYEHHRPLSKKLGVKLWIGTDKDGDQYIYLTKPTRKNNQWRSISEYVEIFRKNKIDQTWDDDLIEVEI